MDEIKKDCYKSNVNTLLMAYIQTDGRGRKNNKWISNLGNLFLSVKLNTFHVPDAFLLNYLSGIIVYDTINSFLLEKISCFSGSSFGVDKTTNPDIKIPNMPKTVV